MTALEAEGGSNGTRYTTSDADTTIARPIYQKLRTFCMDAGIVAHLHHTLLTDFPRFQDLGKSGLTSIQTSTSQDLRQS